MVRFLYTCRRHRNLEVVIYFWRTDRSPDVKTDFNLFINSYYCSHRFYQKQLKFRVLQIETAGPHVISKIKLKTRCNRLSSRHHEKNIKIWFQNPYRNVRYWWVYIIGNRKRLNSYIARSTDRRKTPAFNISKALNLE